MRMTANDDLMKILIVLAMLSYAVSLSGATGAHSSSDAASINAKYASRLELVIPSDGDLVLRGALSGRDTSTSGTLVVRANIPWLLQANGYYGGKMQKMNSHAVILQNQMRIQFTGGGSSEEVVLTNNPKNYRRGLPGEFLVPTDFRQKFSWKDTPADYTMRVLFKLSPD
jgi:hypothetical protein